MDAGSSATVMSAEDRAALVTAIRDNPCIIVLGNTGCGKTTQLPQLLLQAGFGPVCVTQPRRVAAVAAARRVARERRVEVGSEVGFAIRFEQACDTSTRIKFVTDGVLLREAVAQPQLPQYRSLVLDEAHERSLNTDVLLTIAKRILAGLRAPSTSHPHQGPQRCERCTRAEAGGPTRPLLPSGIKPVPARS
jgi:ATP-dependent RNA helicase DHX8/PRP22